MIKVADLSTFFKEAAKTLKSFTTVRVRISTATPDGGVWTGGWSDIVLQKVDGSWVATSDRALLAVYPKLRSALRSLWQDVLRSGQD